jgi:hypothetical protein
VLVKSASHEFDDRPGVNQVGGQISMADGDVVVLGLVASAPHPLELPDARAGDDRLGVHAYRLVGAGYSTYSISSASMCAVTAIRMAS